MKLEQITRYLSPKSIRNYDFSASPTVARLKREDVLAGLSYVSSTCKLGVDLYLAKMNFNSPECAIEGLYREAMLMSKDYHYIEIASKEAFEEVLKILCTFAYQDYSKSASSMRECDMCQGEKFIEIDVFSTKSAHPVKKIKIKDVKKITNFDNPVKEKILCEKCRGKGVIRDSCICQGRGLVVNRKETQMKMVPVFRKCSRCRGRGFSRLKFSIVLRGVQAVWPVKKTIAYQHIRPFFEKLVSRCHQEEANAEYILSRVMKF